MIRSTFQPSALWLTVLALLWLSSCQGGAGAQDDETGFWLENAVTYHGFSAKEAAEALGVPEADVPALIEKHGIRPQAPPQRPGAPLRVLPYPGGRHPRIGFLDGAVDPHRDTKLSVFLPWDQRSYVVLDLPEALWLGTGQERQLMYLAHTHIPTMWDKRGAILERIDWTRHADGQFSFERLLPNAVSFGAKATPQEEWVDLELWMQNASPETITGLQTQVCVLLKGAPGFNDQTNGNKKLLEDVIATGSKDGKHWIVTVWERARIWANPPCPCMHSDPMFPDLKPQEKATLRGRLFFFEGSDLEKEIAKRRRQGTLQASAGL